ncbi:MAG: type II toxin-antitoxin system RelE/ParE family toxin [Pirellulaceae bacterium]
MAKESWPDDAATVHWEGDSREVLARFPAAIRRKIGSDIMRLQLGEMPLSSRPMPSVGRGVFELRQMDDRGWYRVIYLQRIANRIFMLHSFTKKSAKTSARDLGIATTRLRQVRRRLEEHK